MNNVYYAISPNAKAKGEYPIDSEYVLQVSPFWKKTLALAEKRRNKKIYLVDVIIVSPIFYAIYYIFA